MSVFLDQMVCEAVPVPQTVKQIMCINYAYPVSACFNCTLKYYREIAGSTLI